MKEISTLELKHALAKKEKLVLLDCRSQHYYNWEHIPGSLNLRWKYIEEKAKQMFPDKSTLIITYCDGFACNASIRCFQSLQKLGYTNLVEYSGGLADWKAHGLPTEVNHELKIASNVYRFPEQVFYSEEVGSYLIEEADFLLLVDGPQQLTEEIADFLTHLNKPIKVFMSHNPTAGEAKRLQKEFGAQVYLHQGDKNGDWLTVKPDVLVADGFKFNDHLVVIHTPGHSPGSAVLLDTLNKLLFSGDHIIEGDRQGGIYDYIKHDDGISGNPKDRLLSTQKLLDYDFDQILPFHYKMIRRQAKKQLQQFIQKYENYYH